ncbi:MAG TPA: hypothetical protein VGD67_03335 [Pseudonocardiaceae bacterium]
MFHFSHEPGIREFGPRGDPPRVWAIDAAHEPSYWFPRDCPRVTFWSERPHPLLGAARRVHAVEWAWLDRLRAAEVHRYEFDPAPFTVLDAEAGYHEAATTVRPIAVRPMGDLLAAHAAAGVELRFLSTLWPLADAVVAAAERDGALRFSLIRMRNARPRPD